MNPIQFVPSENLVPGSILRVASLRFPGVKHWGVVDWEFDENWQRKMWHSQKADVLRPTNFAYFSSGLPVEILWIPRNYEQQAWVIERLRSKEGLPWQLATANCEQVVRWAVEGTARSEQLTVGIWAALLAGALIFVATGSGE